MSTVRMNRDGTFTVADHARVDLPPELGYPRTGCKCGASYFPCGEWKDAVDAYLDAEASK